MTGKEYRVLVVDDDRTNRMMLTYRLEISGIQAAAAENGKEALRMLRAESFDAVLLDIIMPEMDGYATLENIKNDRSLQAIPVIMISQLDEMDSVIRCLELGAEDYLPKPLNSLLLIARVNGVLLREELSRMKEYYDEQLSLLIEAARAIEKGEASPAGLDAMAQRKDSVGELAQAFQHLLISSGS
jgi:DNA-binding response OmpR family regulator